MKDPNRKFSGYLKQEQNDVDTVFELFMARMSSYFQGNVSTLVTCHIFE